MSQFGVLGPRGTASHHWRSWSPSSFLHPASDAKRAVRLSSLASRAGVLSHQLSSFCTGFPRGIHLSLPPMITSLSRPTSRASRPATSARPPPMSRMQRGRLPHVFRPSWLNQSMPALQTPLNNIRCKLSKFCRMLFQGSRSPSCRGGWTLGRRHLLIKIPGGLGLLSQEGSGALQRFVMALPCFPGHAGVRQNEQAASDGFAVGSQIDGGKPDPVALDRGRLVNFLSHRWVQQQTASGE